MAESAGASSVREAIFFKELFGLLDLIDTDHEDRLLVTFEDEAVGIVDVDLLFEEQLRQPVQIRPAGRE